MANPFDGETFDFWWMRLAPGFIPVARSVSRTLTSTSSSRRSNGSIAMQRIGGGAEGSSVTRRKREMGIKGERERRPGRGKKRANRRQDRRRQPAITSWNVWERVGLGSQRPEPRQTSARPLAPLLSLSLCFSNG